MNSFWEQCKLHCWAVGEPWPAPAEVKLLPAAYNNKTAVSAGKTALCLQLESVAMSVLARLHGNMLK